MAEKLVAVAQERASVSKAPINTAATQSSELGALDVAGIVVPLLKPAQPNIDTAAAIVQSQMNSLAEDALKQMQAPQGTATNAAFGQAPLTSYAPMSAPSSSPSSSGARGGEAFYRAGAVPGGSTINPAYENAAKWIAQPGG